jgi:hypothetical protein
MPLRPAPPPDALDHPCLAQGGRPAGVEEAARRGQAGACRAVLPRPPPGAGRRGLPRRCSAPPPFTSPPCLGAPARQQLLPHRGPSAPPPGLPLPTRAAAAAPHPEQNNPELQATLKLVQHMWNKHHRGVWQALQGYPWSAQVGVPGVRRARSRARHAVPGQARPGQGSRPGATASQAPAHTRRPRRAAGARCQRQHSTAALEPSEAL